MSCHFDSGSINIESGSSKQGDHWDVTFMNKERTTKITMQIPKSGVFEDPHSRAKLSRDECMALAVKISDILRRELHECDEERKPKK